MTEEALQFLCRRDRVLAKVIRAVGPCRLAPKRGRGPYEALVQSVVYQQLNGTAAATIFGRVKALYPHTRFPSPENLLATPDEALRGAGLSRAKTAALKDIAAKTIEGVVPAARAVRKLTDQEIIDRLTVIRGVGPWTVEMFLIFTLGRPDVLPATDYGVRQGFALAYGRKELPKPAELLAFGARWQPYRTTAAWYLWRALELPRNDQAKAEK